MSIEYKERNTIRVTRPQPYIALQQFLKEVIEASNDGWVMTDLVVDHARINGAADFSVTLGRGVVEEPVFAGQDPSEEGVEDPTPKAQESVIESGGDPEWDEVLEDKPESVTESVDLDSLKTKKALSDYADDNNITIPNEHRSVLSMRKYLKEV